MKASTNTGPCARAEDLVGYLYGEATPNEAKDFEQHMLHCAPCSADLKAFGNVREAVGDWREQALGHLASTTFEAKAPQALAPTLPRRRSALAALREFFTLSPAWMRATTAVAAVLFCALAFIAVAYFVQQPRTVVVEKTVKSGYTDEEVKRMVADALKREKESQASVAPVPSPEIARSANTEQPEARPQVERNTYGVSQAANTTRRRRQAVRRSADGASTELASTEYLPFTASGDDEKLPSLADLVGDADRE